jgi:hypothetical protein
VLVTADPAVKGGGHLHPDPNPDQRVRVFVSPALEELAASADSSPALPA